MVKRSTTVAENSRLVLRPVRSINGDGDGLFLEGSLKGSGVLSNIGETSKTIKGSNDLSLGTSRVGGGVRVVSFSGDVGSLDVLETVVH